MNVPVISLNSEISLILSQIKQNVHILNQLDKTPKLYLSIIKKNILKSSLFSARIEGNPHDQKSLRSSPKDDQKKEIYNIEKAFRFINRTWPKKKTILQNDIKRIHSYVGNNLFNDAGYYRTEMSGIFNMAGIPVYVPPSSERILPLMNTLISYIHASPQDGYIKAMISHLFFEKIHPFRDGNGRVGRLLIHTIIRLLEPSQQAIIPFDEYLDNHKEEYYDQLLTGMKNPQSYLQFMLNAYEKQLASFINEVKKGEQNSYVQYSLSPRQEEIMKIIEDHRRVSSDFLNRRFFKVPIRTLRYDIKRLADKNLIKKIGKTKAVLYEKN